MSDAAVAIIVAGAVNIVTLIVGWATLWAKLKYAGMQAEQAVVKATEVERKLDDNTETTNAVNIKADTIVGQTNGNLTATRQIAENLADRVAKLEDYNHTANHRALDAINAMHLKIAALAGMMQKPEANTQPDVGGGR